MKVVLFLVGLGLVLARPSPEQVDEHSLTDEDTVAKKTADPLKTPSADEESDPFSSMLSETSLDEKPKETEDDGVESKPDRPVRPHETSFTAETDPITNSQPGSSDTQNPLTDHDSPLEFFKDESDRRDLETSKSDSQDGADLHASLPDRHADDSSVSDAQVTSPERHAEGSQIADIDETSIDDPEDPISPGHNPDKISPSNAEHGVDIMSQHDPEVSAFDVSHVQEDSEQPSSFQHPIPDTTNDWIPKDGPGEFFAEINNQEDSKPDPTHKDVILPENPHKDSLHPEKPVDKIHPETTVDDQKMSQSDTDQLNQAHDTIQTVTNTDVKETLPIGADSMDNFHCPERYGVFAHPSQCEKYYACTADQPEEKSCQEGFGFDQEKFNRFNPCSSLSLLKCIQKRSPVESIDPGFEDKPRDNPFKPAPSLSAGFGLSPDTAKVPSGPIGSNVRNKPTSGGSAADDDVHHDEDSYLSDDNVSFTPDRFSDSSNSPNRFSGSSNSGDRFSESTDAQNHFSNNNGRFPISTNDEDRFSGASTVQDRFPISSQSEDSFQSHDKSPSALSSFDNFSSGQVDSSSPWDKPIEDEKKVSEFETKNEEPRPFGSGTHEGTSDAI